MDDLISRKAAIDTLMDYDKKLRKINRYQYPYIEHERRGVDKAIVKIANLPSAQPEIIRCKDCKHKPYPSDNYDYDNGDCGFEIIFPDYHCPCRCEDEYYSRIPDDDWFCGNAERRTDE